ncbi:MAG: hypothetical protein ACYS3N_16535, partial [Planctomycetota bacterium]
MANNISDNKSLPLRTSAFLFLSLNLLICIVLWLSFFTARKHFPSWFGPVFLAVVGLLICIICFYIWQLPRTLALVKPTAGYQKALIWLFLVLSVPCTSALHKFAPFRLDAVMRWLEIP